MNLTVAWTAPTGTYPITIKERGEITHTTVLTFQVGLLLTQKPWS